MDALVFVDTIVAAAHAADCRYLLTEDLSHGQLLDGVRVVSPFEASPGSLDDAG